MNVWRCLGAFLFLTAVTCFVGGWLPSYAGEKDKKQDTKDGKKDDGKKDNGKKDDKKGDDKKGDKEAQPSKGGKFEFSAFDKKSGPFFQEVDTNTTQIMKVMGQDVKQNQRQTFYIKWTPEDKDKDGNYVVQQEVVGVKMNIDIGGNTIAFDSTGDQSKQPKNPMTDFFNALMKQKLKYTISPALKVEKVEGRDEFIKALSETNPAIKTLLDTIMSKEALTNMAQVAWWAVPVSGEKTWNRTSELNLGPIGKYDTTFKFTDEGADGSKEKIKIEADLKYTKPGDKGGLPFVIKDAKLSGKSTGGEAVFDTKKGRIDSSKLTMKLEGDLTIEVGNMATEIKLNQDQVSSTKSADKLEDLIKK
jgi:hypothetical protein